MRVSKRTQTIIERRHNASDSHWLTTLVRGARGGFMIVVSAQERDGSIRVIQQVRGRGPHPILADTIIALQDRYDQAVQIAFGRAKAEYPLAIRHLSILLFLWSGAILNCQAGPMEARHIANDCVETCERVRTQLSSTSEVTRFASSMAAVRCDRRQNAA